MSSVTTLGLHSVLQFSLDNDVTLQAIAFQIVILGTIDHSRHFDRRPETMEKLQDLKVSLLGGEKTGLIDFSQSSLLSAGDTLLQLLRMLTTL